jgi:hypothetical protein
VATLRVEAPPLLAAALTEARVLAGDRAWVAPADATVLEAARLLTLLAGAWPEPLVQVQASGAVALEWEAGARGWLVLTVHGNATLQHAAVIDGDEYGLTEDFGDAIPEWAQELLRRLWAHPVSQG